MGVPAIRVTACQGRGYRTMYVRSFAFESGTMPPVGCTPVGCLDVDVLAMAALAAGTALALGAFVALVYLRDAREVLEEEITRTVAERDAFATFARRVNGIDGGPATTGAAGRAGEIISRSPSRSPSTDARLERVRTAYRETVMAVPHYRVEYDETLAESVAAEFCEEVSAAVRDGTRFRPQLKGALVQGSQRSRNEREALLATLNRERDALEDASAAFTEIEDTLGRMDDRPLPEKSLGDLGADWERMAALERRCTGIIADRQDRIHANRAVSAHSRTLDLHEYLYGPLPVTNPVLADAAELLLEIRRGRRRLVGAALNRA